MFFLKLTSLGFRTLGVGFIGSSVSGFSVVVGGFGRLCGDLRVQSLCNYSSNPYIEALVHG